MEHLTDRSETSDTVFSHTLRRHAMWSSLLWTHYYLCAVPQDVLCSGCTAVVWCASVLYSSVASAANESRNGFVTCPARLLTGQLGRVAQSPIYHPPSSK